MRRLAALIIVVLSCACDGSRSRGPGSETPTDGSTALVDAGVVVADGGPSGDGGHSVVPDGSVAPSDGGGSICGPIGSWECGPRECHDNPACLARDLSRAGWDGYTDCGTGAFTEADSRAACEVGPPLGDWSTPFRCDQASFSGTLRFFCAPDGSEVVVRYQAHGRMPAGTGTEIYSTYGTDFWQGSFGGSGTGHLHVDETDTLGSIYFVGYQPASIPESGATTLTLWFIVSSFSTTASEPFIGGGFQVSLDATGPLD